MQTPLPCWDPVHPEARGVNIDGACLFDPFSRGNVQAILRLFSMASVPAGTVFCQDRLEKAGRASPYTIGTNDDFSSGVGRNLGGTLGFEEIRVTFTNIGDTIEGADIGPVLSELQQQEERVVRACDKYLRRYDPPSAAIFARMFLCPVCRKDARALSGCRDLLCRLPQPGGRGPVPGRAYGRALAGKRDSSRPTARILLSGPHLSVRSAGTWHSVASFPPSGGQSGCIPPLLQVSTVHSPLLRMS